MVICYEFLYDKIFKIFRSDTFNFERQTYLEFCLTSHKLIADCHNRYFYDT